MVVPIYLKDGELNLKEGWEVLEVETKEEAESLLRLVDMRGYMGIWKVPRALRGGYLLKEIRAYLERAYRRMRKAQEAIKERKEHNEDR
jgi:hypothetical protein